MRRTSRIGATLAALVLSWPAAAQTPATPIQPAPPTKTSKRPIPMKVELTFEPVSYAELAGWDEDDHAAAFQAFLRSCAIVLKKADKGTLAATYPAALLDACKAASAMKGRAISKVDAKSFFETTFTPNRIVHSGAAGMLTGYYEPILEGSRTQGGAYAAPIYRRPPELVNLVEEAKRGAVGNSLTHARKTESGTEAYFTRADIDNGALAGRGLEFLWLTDPVETFMMHIQGSGRIHLPDGSMIRITYDGKNGHPYTSVGRYLIESKQVSADKMSLDAMKDWLKADPERGRSAMQQNASFIFFRELSGKEADSALGVMDIPLTSGRSLAVDGGYHDIGTPVWVAAPKITHATKADGWRRLMIAQDVGSAIKGPERGDLFFGSGDEAGKLAGITKHPGNFFMLIANPPAVAQDPWAARTFKQAGQ